MTAGEGSPVSVSRSAGDVLIAAAIGGRSSSGDWIELALWAAGSLALAGFVAARRPGVQDDPRRGGSRDPDIRGRGLPFLLARLGAAIRRGAAAVRERIAAIPVSVDSRESTRVIPTGVFHGPFPYGRPA